MNKNENFIIFSDLVHLACKMKWIILGGALAFAFVGIYVRSQKPVLHEVTAIFKEVGGSSSSPMGGMFQTILHTIGVGGGHQGHVLFNSAPIL
jgi:hypothetical protein